MAGSLRSAHSRRAYRQALRDFLAWYGGQSEASFGRALVQQYRAHLEALGRAPATINLHLAALRKLAGEAADRGLLDRETAAGILRVRGTRRLGVRLGNWLTREQARNLLLAADPGSLKGKRDRAILSLLIGCGLRRAELLALSLETFQQREGRWVLVDLVGKGQRLRSVPVPGWVKWAVDEWAAAAGISQGRLFWGVRKGGRLRGEGLSEKAIWSVVEGYARRSGIGKISPHDLRRTCAKLCRSAGGELEQIQLLLGHASIQTTERYLGVRQNLAEAVNDRLGLWE